MCYDFADHRFNHYTVGTPPERREENEKGEGWEENRWKKNGENVKKNNRQKERESKRTRRKWERWEVEERKEKRDRGKEGGKETRKKGDVEKDEEEKKLN